jgi:hypothetical protein
MGVLTEQWYPLAETVSPGVTKAEYVWVTTFQNAIIQWLAHAGGKPWQEIELEAKQIADSAVLRFEQRFGG